MLNRTMAIVLVFVLLLVAACGGDDDSSDNGDDQDPTATEQTSGSDTQPTEADDAAGDDDSATADATPDDDATVDDSAATEPTDDATADDAGDDDATVDDAGSTATSESTSQATEAPSGDSGSRSIEHAMGTLEIEGVPERIVVLEWTYAEDLLAVGVQPAGVADIEGYNAWVNIEPTLDDDVTDVGTRQEPSLESIAALEPDLIIGVQFRHEPIYEDLSSIAPTLLFNPYPEDPSFNQFQEMEQTFMAIATAVDRADEGQQVLDDMHAHFDDVAAQLRDALGDDDGDGELDDDDFVVVQAFTSEDTPQIRMFTDNSMAVQIFEAVGLENDWEGEFDPFGFNTVGIEALTEVDDAYFFYVAQESDNPFENQWADNPVWTDLDFVEDGEVFPLGGDTWLFGGPLSAELIADKILAALAG